MQKQLLALQFTRLNWPLWLRRWIQPRNAQPVERFTETVLRVYLPVATLVTLLMLPSALFYITTTIDFESMLLTIVPWLVWLFLVFIFHALALLAIYKNRLRLAVKLTIAAYFITVGGLMLVAGYSDPTVIAGLMIELVVCSMVVLDRRSVIPLTIGTTILIGGVVAIEQDV